jgi:hypothetical protein
MSQTSVRTVSAQLAGPNGTLSPSSMPMRCRRTRPRRRKPLAQSGGSAGSPHSCSSAVITR